MYSINIATPGDPPNTWVCTCPGFQFRGYCKHIGQIVLCLWDEVEGPEEQTNQQRKDQICPRCGNNTSKYLINET